MKESMRDPGRDPARDSVRVSVRVSMRDPTRESEGGYVGEDQTRDGIGASPRQSLEGDSMASGHGAKQKMELRGGGTQLEGSLIMKSLIHSRQEED
jgi:hypothetical protein